MNEIFDENGEARVGVFICHCGSNIGGVIDCKILAENAALLPGVAHAEDAMYTCSEVGLTRIKDAIMAFKLTRVVVASCSPRTHEPLFRATIHDAGLNPFLFEMANIREQCSWVHAGEPDLALEKAWDLVKMAVAKAKLLDPLEKIQLGVNPSVVIVGGGISGMSAALNLGRQGFKVYLVEKEKELGGMVKNLHKIFPTGEDAASFLHGHVAMLRQQPSIEIMTGGRINAVRGFVGNFEIEVQVGDALHSVKAGTVILATGALVLPAREVNLFQGDRVVNQLELEGLLRVGPVPATNIVMIQCAGARNPERPYCSGICCGIAIKNALLLRETNPAANVTILYRDIQVLGPTYEGLYEKARAAGILFLKYGPDKPPRVEQTAVRVFDELITQEVEIPRDLVVLSTPLVPQEDASALSQFFKVPRDACGFFLEAHVKLRPVDFATDGIYVCGCAKWPAWIPEAVSQALAAAARASTIVSHPFIEVEGSTASIPEALKHNCHGCEVCVTVCPFHAIKKNERDEIEIIQVLCKGCGTCGATCPEKAISISNFSDEQILAQIRALKE